MTSAIVFQLSSTVPAGNAERGEVGQSIINQIWNLCSKGMQYTMEMDWMSSLSVYCLPFAHFSAPLLSPCKCNIFISFALSKCENISQENHSKNMCEWRWMMDRPEPKEWLPAAHKRPRDDSKSRVCKLPTKPLFPFKSLIRCWESITLGPVWRVSLARLCMVWKPSCLLRFGEVGVKTPTLFVCVLGFFFFYAKQNETGTGHRLMLKLDI